MLEGLPEDFPVYRKLHGGTSFYRIESARSFTEIQVIGTRRLIHMIKATAYPEMVRIKDMLKDTETYLPITETSWLQEVDRM